MPLPRLMAILNITPNSFFDGGKWLDPKAAIAHGLQLAQEGAHCIDVGGESTKPGADAVPAQEQIRRVIPVIAGLRAALDAMGLKATNLSIDTTQASVALAALDAGAAMVNDVAAGQDDAQLLPLVGRQNARICLMHRQGTPATMQLAPTYDDVVAQVKAHLLARAAAAQDAGIARQHIWLDPGIGFGKTLEHNLLLMRALPEFVATGYPILLGASRKQWIAQVMGPNQPPPPQDRLGGSIAASLWAAQCGVAVVRVHEVAPHAQALSAWAAIQGASVR